MTFEPVPAVWAKSDTHEPLIIKLTDISARTLWVFESNALNDYEVYIADVLNGNVVAMTSKGLQFQERQRSTLFRSLRQNVASKDSSKALIDLADFYDLPPGRYLFHAKLISTTEDALDEATQRRKPEAKIPALSASLAIEITP